MLDFVLDIISSRIEEMKFKSLVYYVPFDKKKKTQKILIF